MQNRSPTLHRWCHAKSLISRDGSRSALRSFGFASLKGEARFVYAQKNRAPRGRPIDEAGDAAPAIDVHGVTAAGVSVRRLRFGAIARALAPRTSDRGAIST